MLTIIQIAFRLTARHWQMSLFIFVINLIFGLIIAPQMYWQLEKEANHSMELDKLLNDFDFATFSDFMRQSGKTLRSLIPIASILGLVYFILNLFFAGGIIGKYCKANEDFRISDFLKDSKDYFLRYLLLFLIQLIMFLIVVFLGGLIFFVFALIAEGGNERTYFFALLIPFMIWIFLMTLVLNIGDFAKIIIYRNQSGVWDAFIDAFAYVFKNFKAVGIYWIMIGIFIVLSALYLLLDAYIGMVSGLLIAVMFVIQQAFIFGRIYIRNWMMGNACQYYALKPIPVKVIPQPIVEEATDLDINDSENKLSDTE